MKLHTARTIGMTGDVTWTSGIFDGSDNVTGVASLKTSGVSAGSYAKVTVNAKGIVTAGENPTTLSGHGITDAVALTEVGVSVAPLVDGLIPSSNLPSYVDDILEFATITAFPTAGESGKIYIALATNLTYRWTGTNYIQIGSAGSGGVVSVSALTLTSNGTDVTSTVLNSTTTPVITLNLPTANSTSRGALSATDWSIFNGKQAALVSGTTIKTINGASVLGSGDIVVASSYSLPAATPTTLGGVKVDGTTILVDGSGLISAVGGGGGGSGAFSTFSIVDGELIVDHSSSFTLSIVDGEFISEYN
jgi:phage-related tail fiber protein